MKDYNLNITVYDPWANPAIAEREYGIKITNELPKEQFDATVLAVAHNEFNDMDINQFKKSNSVVYDVKWVLNGISDGKL